MMRRGPPYSPTIVAAGSEARMSVRGLGCVRTRWRVLLGFATKRVRHVDQPHTVAVNPQNGCHQISGLVQTFFVAFFDDVERLPSSLRAVPDILVAETRSELIAMPFDGLQSPPRLRRP